MRPWPMVGLLFSMPVAKLNGIIVKNRSRSARAPELAPAVVRHDDGVGADVDRAARVVRMHHAFQNQLALPQLAHPAHGLKVEGRVELRLDPLRQRADRMPFLDLVLEVAEGVA